MAQFDSFDQLTDDAEERATAVEIDGLTLPWLLDGLAIRRAATEGVQLGDVLARLSSTVPDGMDGDALAEMGKGERREAIQEHLASLSGEDKKKEQKRRMRAVQETIEAYADLLWMGFLRFEPGLDRDLIQGKVDFQTVRKLPTDLLMQHIDGEADPQENGQAVGN